jgi:hypothetical protein
MRNGKNSYVTKQFKRKENENGWRVSLLQFHSRLKCLNDSYVFSLQSWERLIQQSQIQESVEKHSKPYAYYVEKGHKDQWAFSTLWHLLVGRQKNDVTALRVAKMRVGWSQSVTNRHKLSQIWRYFRKCEWESNSVPVTALTKSNSEMECKNKLPFLWFSGSRVTKSFCKGIVIDFELSDLDWEEKNQD